MMSNQEDLVGRAKINWQQRAGKRTTFRAELRVIPRWLLAVVVGLCIVGTIGGVLWGIFLPGIGIIEPLSQRVRIELVLGVLVAWITSVAVFFYGYIWADAKRRGMSPVLWLLVSLLMPYLIGAILYFAVREPLPMDCPQCGRKVNTHFNFCPDCQFNLRPKYPQRRPSDRFCPYCSASLQPDAPTQVAAPTA